MGFKSINLEILGCKRYDQLLSIYGIAAKCCCYHLLGDYHCSKHEVEVFALFIKEIVNSGDEIKSTSFETYENCCNNV